MKQLVLAVLAALSMVSCQKMLENEAEIKYEENEKEIQNYMSTSNLTFQKSATGLYYSYVTKNPNGVQAKIGDEVSIHYSLYKMSGVRFDSTERLKNQPFSYIFGIQSLIPGMDEAVLAMHSGERVMLLMNHFLAFGSQSNDILPAYSAIRADLEIVKVRSEDMQIDDYIANKNLTLTEKTASGLRFIQTTSTANAQVKAGDMVTVKYTGKLLSDKQFDTGEIQVRVGSGNVIKGFEEGVAKMKIGEKATLVFPSSLGYGTQGSGNTIPPYAPLLFEVEVVK
ncbi:MAG: FKBP-type peptidyl-prolyl cis-trans isomerase [Spirosomataceae bacterium]